MTVDSTKMYASNMVLTPEVIDKLVEIFTIVAKANRFVHVKSNHFKSDLGQHYYLDTLGFHTQNQFANRGIEEKERELDKLIKQYTNLISDDYMGNRSTHKVLKIISRRDLGDKRKLELIKHHLTK